METVEEKVTEPEDKNEKLALFDGDDDEDNNNIAQTENNFKLREEYEGKKGKKVKTYVFVMKMNLSHIIFVAF